MSSGQTVSDQFIVGGDAYLVVDDDVGRRVVLCAPSQWLAARRCLVDCGRLRDLPEPQGTGSSSELPEDALSLEERLDQALDVTLFWSEEASKTPEIQAALRWIRLLARERKVPPPLWIEPLDNWPLPTICQFVDWAFLREPRQVHPATIIGLAMAFGLILGTRGQGWTVALLLISLGLWVLVSQLIEKPDWLAVKSAQTIEKLRSADAVRVLQLYGKALDWLFGPKLLSWRSLKLSAMISVLPLALGALSGLLDGLSHQRSLWELPEASAAMLILVASLMVVSSATDFLSLVFTRQVLRRLTSPERVPPRRRHLLGWLCIDVVVMLSLMAAPVFLNLAALGAMDSMDLAVWGHIVITHTALFLTGFIDPIALPWDVTTTFWVCTGVAALTAALPSLCYVLAGALALATHSFAAPMKHQVVALLHSLAYRRSGRVPFFYLATVVAFSMGKWAFLHTQQPPAPPMANTVGRTLESGQAPLWPARPTPAAAKLATTPEPQDGVLAESVVLGVTELTQAEWTRIVELGSRTDYEWGLSKQPNAMPDPSLPVTTISWCEAVRFANLASLVAGLEAVYYQESTPHDPTLPDCELWMKGEAGEEERALQQVRARSGAQGLRLPTYAEWLVAASGRSAGPNPPPFEGVLHAGSSHARAQPVRAAFFNPLGLSDLAGSVREWVFEDEQLARDDLGYLTMPILGGSWDLPAEQATPWRLSRKPLTYKSPKVGFRLACTVVDMDAAEPCPSLKRLRAKDKQCP